MVPSLAASHSPAEIDLWSLRQETCPITLNHRNKLPNPRLRHGRRSRFRPSCKQVLHVVGLHAPRRLTVAIPLATFEKPVHRHLRT